MQSASLRASLVNVRQFSIVYVKCIKLTYKFNCVWHTMDTCSFIFHNNGTNENNAQVFSADKIFVEELVIICPSRAATRGNGSNLHGTALTLKVHTPL